MRTMGGLFIGALALLIEDMLFTFHHATVLEGLAFLRAKGFISIGTVTRVQTSTFVFNGLMTAFDCTSVLIGTSVLTADWSELVVAGAVEMRRLEPVKVVTRAAVR